MIRVCCVVAFSLLWPGLAAFEANAQAPSPAGSRIIDPATIAAYKELGGTPGVMDRSAELPPDDEYDFTMPGFDPAISSSKTGLPGFFFLSDLTKDLPPVDVPFGIQFLESRLSDAGVRRLSHLKNLRMLVCYGSSVTDDGLKALAGIEGLTHLELPASSITDKGLKHLRGMSSLRELNLSHTKITSKGLAELAELKSLRCLRIRRDNFDKTADLRELGKFKNLSILGWPSYQATDLEMPLVAGLKSLSRLSLTFPITDKGLGQLRGNQSLVSLELRRTETTDACLQDIVTLTNLTNLDISETSITDEGHAKLAALANLTALRPSSGSDEALKNISRLKTLTDLNLEDGDVTDSGLAHLPSLTKLTRLKLYGPFTDAGLKHVGRLENLTELDLTNVSLTAAGLRHLTGLKKLSVLRLSLPTTSQQDAEESDGAPEKKAVVFKKLARQGDEMMEEISNMRRLAELHAHGGVVSDIGIAKLRSLPNLAKLNLENTTGFTGSGLADLKDLPKLTWLSVYGTQVTDKGMEDVAKLQHLVFFNAGQAMQLGNDGIKQIAKIPSLKRVWLWHTYGMKDEGFLSLIALKEMCHVHIGSTPVTEKARDTLRKALPRCVIEGG